MSSRSVEMEESEENKGDDAEEEVFALALT